MGCGVIKTNESSEQYDDDNINQSELLPEVQVSKKSNAERKNSKNNNISENNQDNSISKYLKNKKNSKKIIKSKSINKKIEELNEANLKNNDNKKEVISPIKLNQNLEKKIENLKEMEEKKSGPEIEDISNKGENKKEEEKNVKEKDKNKNKKEDNDDIGSLLQRKAYTTDKLPISKANITLSSEEEKLPKVIQKNEMSNGFLDKKYLEIEIKANRYETIFPIWIQKEEEIEFNVLGKWKINSQIECYSKGIQTNKEEEDNLNSNSNNEQKKFNDGALIGRVLKGKPFIIYDGLKFTSDISGPLILKMYLKNLWDKEQPQGSLKLKIYGAQKIENVEDLDEKIGWWKQLSKIEFINKDHLPDYILPNTEKSIIILFNKLRHDSKLFTSQYLDNYQRLTPTTKKIYNQFIENKDEFIPFKINLSIIKLLNNFYNLFIKDNNKKSFKEDNWAYILRSENSLKKYLEESFSNKKKIFVSIIRYYEDNPFFLALRVLFRNNIRDNMLSYNFVEISIIILCDKQRKDGKKIYYCIVVLSDQNENDKVNYDLNMNIEKFIEEEKKIENKLIISKQIKI